MTAARFAPVWKFAVKRARECARLTARVRELELDNAILRAHLRLARNQAETAMVVATGAVWTEADDAAVRALDTGGAA